MNRLIEGLAEVCRERLLDEKWLLAPSMRVGHQWLAAVATSGQPAVNVRVKTLTSLALDLAGPAMARSGAELATDRGAAILIDRIFRRLATGRLKYLGQLRPSTGLAETIGRSIEALRLAGLGPDEIDPGRFEVATKGREILLILREYLGELKARGLVDYADVLRLAAARLADEPAAPGAEVVVLEPEDLWTSVLERLLLAGLRSGQRVQLPVDEPAGDCATHLPVSIFHAVGEVNEVREALRRALAEGVPLDEIEVLYTDSAAYVPLLYETMAALVGDEEAPDEELPLTLVEGIPCRYSRPGRLLAGWVAWACDGFPQDRLVKMIRDGLLAVPGGGDAKPSMPRLAAVLRGVGIGAGRERYIEQLDAAIAAARRPRRGGEDEDADASAGNEWQLAALVALRRLVAVLLEISPGPDAGPQQVLAAGRALLERLARTVNKTDNYAREALVRQIDELARWTGGEEPLSLEAWAWLGALPSESRILGIGPRPGCLHAAPIYSGGHSGRKHTYILGLDEGRFPGAGAQDPLLLDAERRALGAELPTAMSQLDQRVLAFRRLVARVRGRLVMSYSCHDLVDDRPRFPSPLLVAAYGVISGDGDPSQQKLLEWLGRPASFAPREAERAISAGEWWLWRMCAGGGGDEQFVGRWFPHLERGAEAIRRRASEAFTEYDGRVVEAAGELDPCGPQGPVMSSSKLECLGRCGLAYFFRWGLRVRPPEELGVDPTWWLDPLSAGSLLHGVFERFFRARVDRDEAPCVADHWAELEAILQTEIEEYRQGYPPPSESVFEAQCRQLRRAAWIMLTEEEEHCRQTGSRPVYLEACLGLPAGAGTPLDAAEPIRVELGDGRCIRACGKVDRIDRVAPQEYAIWDYKTGSAWKYQPGDPFRQGRVVQPALYLAMVARRLKEIEPEARVGHFGFFFPSQRERGRRIQWTAEQLAEGRKVLGALADVAGRGAFLPTDNADDCKFCDYLPICGDPQAVAQASKGKLAAGEKLLGPISGLRGHGEA